MPDPATSFAVSLAAGLAQEIVDLEPTLSGNGTDFQQVLGNLVQLAPSFSLRGGTPEIMRGIIARGLGLR